MLCSINTRLLDDKIAALLDTTRLGLNAITFLSSLNCPWWNVVSNPFQSICVLISIGTVESFALLPTAIQTLQNIAAKYNSHLSTEALKTAFALVQGARDRKGRELSSLDDALGRLRGDCLLLRNLPMTCQ